MKPTPQNNIQHQRQGDQRPISENSHFPSTDYAFQTTTLETAVRSPGSAEKAVSEARTFRNISRRFIEVSAGREFVAEGLVFACIALTAAGPLTALLIQLSSVIEYR